MRFRPSFFLAACCFLLLLTGCQTNTVIVNDLGERQANEIIVFLASKGIRSQKVPTPTAGGAVGAGNSEGKMWSISVTDKQAIDAMAILNRNGLPRIKSPTLLELFAKSGLISSASEESIRYQAGLAAQLAGVIRMIDGVIDANVELSIPQDQTGFPGQENSPKEQVTAAVYVKHQGILDDPNSHLITKIKRLIAGSVPGLSVNNVTVISDRSRFTDIRIDEEGEPITPEAKEYVSIWSIVMSKGSAAKFRALFFTLTLLLIALALLMGWMFWKVYPLLRDGGLKRLLSPTPFKAELETDASSGHEEPPSD